MHVHATSGYREVPATFNAVLARLDSSTSGITFTSSSRRDADVVVSYRELAALVRGNVLHFASLGVTFGTRVAIALETDLEHVVALLSLMAMGALPVSVKPRRGSVEPHAGYLARVVARHGVRHAYGALPITGSHVRQVGWDPGARSDDARTVVEVEPGDLAFVQFSSGSLGDPKAVPIRHESLMHNLTAILGVDGRTPDYLGYNFLPLSHDMGLVGGLLSNLVFQNPLVLSPVQQFLRRPADVFERTRSSPATGVAMPDFAIKHLLRHLEARADGTRGDLLAPLRTVYCGAEPIQRSTIERLATAGPRFGFDPQALVFCYGLAEATLMVTARRFDSLERSFREGRTGRFVANVGTPADGTALRVDDAGVLHVRGPGVCHGYLEDTAAPGGGGPGRWHDTGDIALQRDGELYISGRAKELVIVGGENVFAADIEDFVSRLPGVAELLVMTEDDRFYLLVVPRREAGALDAEALASRVGAELGAFPAGVAFGPSNAVLRTTSGKPMRSKTLVHLREQGLLA